MEFDNELTYNIPFNNSKESDKRNYCNNISEKTARDIYFCQDNSEDYSYGDTRWK